MHQNKNQKRALQKVVQKRDNEDGTLHVKRTKTITISL